MSERTQRLGRWGEELVAAHLMDTGYEIVARNWRCPAGEIDIAARREDQLALVEVRTRRGARCGRPEESLSPRKRKTLLACGLYLVAELDWAGPWRIDLAAVELPAADGEPTIRLIEHAVED